MNEFTPWPDDFAARYRAAGLWQGKTLAALLDEWAAAHGDSTALVSGVDRITYYELRERSERLARVLRKLGIRRGDRVVVQLPNIPEFVVLSFALFRIGAQPVMALPPFRKREIGYLVEISGAVGYAVPAHLKGFDYTAMAREVRAEQPCLRHVLVVGDDVPDDFSNLRLLCRAAGNNASGPDDFTETGPRPGDVALFLLSGGTTGLPKLIPRTHDDYAYNARACADVCRLGPDSACLVCLPIAHNFPLACPGLLGVLCQGGRVVLSLSASAENAFPLIERERIDITAVVPAVAVNWMNSPLLQRYDLTSLRVLQVGGARLNPEAARRVRPTLGCVLQQVFGMAEGLINMTRLDDPDRFIIETQGRPVSQEDEIRVVDEQGDPVADGQPGELLTRGPYTLRGYFNAEAHNRQAFTADGYYRTGDIVVMDEFGNLAVHGRAKDMINRGGEKISAEEVENLVLSHPAVYNVAAVAMPDPDLGERVCAYVVPHTGMQVTLDAVVAHLATRGIAYFKVPERLEILEALPLTNVGKVDKKALRDDIADKLRREFAHPIKEEQT